MPEVIRVEVPKDKYERCKLLADWLNDNVERCVWTEKVLLGNGYAGRCDGLVKMKDGSLAVIDLKNRKVNAKYGVAAYESDLAQLSAYSECIEEKPKAISVIIASNEPAILQIREWERHEMEAAFVAFKSLLKVWAWSKDYTPPGMEL